MLQTIRLLAVSPRHEAYAQSLVGLLIWLVTVALIQPGWSAALLVFGPLVLYPLLFELIEESRQRRLALFAFLPALASYAFEQGDLAGALTAPWLVFTLALLGRRAVARWKDRDYVLLTIKGFLVVGACWLVLARLGQRPLGFEHAIVHATAVHFHYAGFVLPIIALQWVHTAPSRGRLLLLTWLLLGVPAVALGITLSAFQTHWPELIAVLWFAAACVSFAIAQVRFAWRTSELRCRWLLMLSSVALVAAMGFALIYGTRHYMTADWLDIPLMLRTHGPIQVFGFALPGVLGWTIAAGSNQPSLAVSRGESTVR